MHFKASEIWHKFKSKVPKIHAFKEQINYVFFGILTTLVNFLSYLFASRICALSPSISTFAAWFAAVLFAYITNRIFVFKSTNLRILKECVSFYLARIFTGLFEISAMWFLAEFLGLYDIGVKVILLIFLVLGNYILSKFWVFKRT